MFHDKYYNRMKLKSKKFSYICRKNEESLFFPENQLYLSENFQI